MQEQILPLLLHRNGGSAPTYQWKINGTNIGSPSTTATFNSSTLANNDAVTCLMVSNSACASTPNANSNTLNITVNPNLVPSVSVSPSPETLFAVALRLHLQQVLPMVVHHQHIVGQLMEMRKQAQQASWAKHFTNAGTSPIQATIIATLNVSQDLCNNEFSSFESNYCYHQSNTYPFDCCFNSSNFNMSRSKYHIYCNTD
ncbi:MAG: hypothetical protein IPK03_01205 [Bacteroidetes bacterium]|nr:hypothetical protein [Bacteroidota bacterium]